MISLQEQWSYTNNLQNHALQGWKRHSDVVVMSAELELAAWNLDGKKLWSTFVEPPWVYEVWGTRLQLDVMGKKSSFDVKAGPKWGGPSMGVRRNNRITWNCRGRPPFLASLGRVLLAEFHIVRRMTETP